ncbi:AI-2E family transporter [Coralloluteibacterium stylophorae]|uniref:AI-2E family transporter n=1 Tax=Coralloluteibacterium stylophorae TaxID=1776034 RepID=UPI0030843044
MRAPAAEALADSGRALRLWLGGQAVAMLAVGVLTGLGLWALGVPAALGLAIIATLLDFVPLVGPIAAAVPAILLALTVDPRTGLLTTLLYLVVQQIEGNLLQPLVQQRAVELPPALLLFALIGAGLLFGVLGVLLAAPLTVVIFVLVKRLYVRETLGEDTDVPGEAS